MEQDKNIKMLIKLRIVSHLKLLLTLYKASIDWVVWLYIIIPALGIMGYNYYKWWVVKWDIVGFNFDLEPMIYIGLFIILMLGNLRFFLEKADQLFLRQYEQQYYRLKQLGFYYTSFVHFMKLLVIHSILAPILLFQLEKGLVYSLCLFILSFSISLLIPTIRQLLHFRYRNWLYYFIYWLVVILIGISFLGVLYSWNVYNDRWLMILSSHFFVLLAYQLIRIRLSITSVFLEELSQELTLKYRFVSSLLMSAGMVGAPQFQQIKPPKMNKRPWIFRNSGRIFSKRTPEKAFLELHIKYLLRNKQMRVLFLQMFVVSIFGLFFVPIFLKWFVLGISIIMFIHMNSSSASEMKRNSFLSSVDWDRGKLILMTARSVFITNMPFIAVIGAVAGYLLLPWWGGFMVSLTSIGVSYVLQPLFQK